MTILVWVLLKLIVRQFEENGSVQFALNWVFNDKSLYKTGFDELNYIQEYW